MNGLAEVGSYVRDLGASRERLIENALDWEHLPHLHAGSFCAIEVRDHGANGWRADARLADGRPVILDLRLTMAGWVTRTEVESRLSSEIHSRAEATGPNSCRVSVRFLVADVSEERRGVTGIYYQRLYRELYDEDERMMIARADALRRSPAASRLRRIVTLTDGSTHEIPLYCPHQGLPLDAEPDSAGIVTCPWHGFRFDVRTGHCVSGQLVGWARVVPNDGVATSLRR